MRRALALAASALVAAAALPAPGTAAEPKRPSAGLRAYGLDWIQYIRPKDLPPTRYAVCIVDTGVAITPDTPADNPNGPIIKRLAIDGGSGEPQATTPQHLHGTRMAMTAVAPRNGWGTVGMFPAGRVISVRATVDGEATFRTAGYLRGIDICLRQSVEQPISAINLSVACETCTSTEAETRAMAERIAMSQQRGIPIVVAAGNNPGPLAYPANVAGVLAVGAGGTRGRRCPYGSWDSSGFALAPACPVTSAEPLSGAAEPKSDGGASAAAVQVSTLIAALAGLKPDQAGEVSGWVARSRRTKNGLPTIDGRSAARLAGLSTVVRHADRRLTTKPVLTKR